MAKTYKYGFVIEGDSDKGVKSIRKVREEVSGLDSQTGKARTATKNWRSEIDKQTSSLRKHGKALLSTKNMIIGIVGATGIGMLLRGFKDTVVETERMRASLETMTGSQMAAAAAFDQLTKFAAKTPFTLDQSVNGFIKLKALGLDPSERAMMSFANTSAAMGKDLSQMIEAVADASTNEFERLKEFGITAKQQGDQVSLTFQGVTTTIAKESAAITEYLTQIGENQFGDAAAKQMERLPGLLSNLSDSVGDFYRKIGDIGGIALFADVLELSGSAVKGLTNNMEPLVDALGRLTKVIAVGGALYAASIALPIAWTAGGVAIQALGAYAVTTWGILSSGAGVMTVLNTSLYGTSVSAGLAAGSISKLGLALNVLFAAFVGWEIGSLLHDNFLQARLAGMAFVQTMLNGFERLSFAGQVLWETFSFSFDKATSWITDKYSSLLGVIADGLDLLGADVLAAGYRTFADNLNTSESAAKGLKERVTELRGEMDANIATNNQIILAMVDFEIGAIGAGEAVGALATTQTEADATTKVLTESLGNLTRQQVLYNDQVKGTTERYFPLIAAQNKLNESTNDLWGLLTLGAITYDQYNEAMARVTAGYDSQVDSINGVVTSTGAAVTGMENFSVAASQATEQSSRQFDDLRNSISDSFANMRESGKSFTESLIDSFKYMGNKIMADLAASGFLSLLTGKGGFSLSDTLQNAGTSGQILNSILGGGEGAGSLFGFGSSASALPAANAGSAAWGSFYSGAPAAGGSGLISSATSFLTSPVGMAAAAALAAKLIHDYTSNPDGYTRSNAGFVAANTPSLVGSNRAFEVEQFSSGLNVTGFNRRSTVGEATEIIDIFRSIDDAVAQAIVGAGGRVDLSNAQFRGVGEDGIFGTDGTFFGSGGKTEDMAAQFMLFAGQIIEGSEGLSAAVLSSLESAQSVDQMLAVLSTAQSDVIAQNITSLEQSLLSGASGIDQAVLEQLKSAQSVSGIADILDNSGIGLNLFNKELERVVSEAEASGKALGDVGDGLRTISRNLDQIAAEQEAARKKASGEFVAKIDSLFGGSSSVRSALGTAANDPYARLTGSTANRETQFLRDILGSSSIDYINVLALKDVLGDKDEFGYNKSWGPAQQMAIIAGVKALAENGGLSDALASIGILGNVDPNYTPWDVSTRNVPAFATGGDHLGGWRMVGERGPELEYTGPSKIYNAERTSRMMNQSGGSQVSRQEMEVMLREMHKIATQTEKTADILTRATRGGDFMFTKVAA